MDENRARLPRAALTVLCVLGVFFNAEGAAVRGGTPGNL